MRDNLCLIFSHLNEGKGYSLVKAKKCLQLWTTSMTSLGLTMVKISSETCRIY